MNEKIEKLKTIMKENSRRDGFIHAPWFIERHLTIVERLVEEICDMYPAADRDVCRTLVWFHDFGKPLDFNNEKNETEVSGVRTMKEIGFDEKYIDLIVEYRRIMESKMSYDLREAPLEVQIISSADGASHMIGPFLLLWWWENPEKDYLELMQDNHKKIKKDRERKIVLDEVKEKMKRRYDTFIETCGHLPEKLLE